MTFQPIAPLLACQGTILRKLAQTVRYTASLQGRSLTPGDVATEILELVGHHVRVARIARHWTIRELAERSGVSVRFLVQLESGRGNISVKRLADLARAFKISTADLLSEDSPDAPRVVALLGLRGAGKTTIGKQL